MNRILNHLEDFIMKPRILFAGIAASFLMLVSGFALAASDGELGLTSEGEVEITLDIGDRVQISDLDDIVLTWDGVTDTGNIEATEEVCVYSSATSGYQITISGIQSSGFALNAGGPTMITYNVHWEDDPINDDNTGFRAVTKGSPLRNNIGDAEFYTCGGGTNARLRIQVARSGLPATTAGNYADTLTLNVAPE